MMVCHLIDPIVSPTFADVLATSLNISICNQNIGMSLPFYQPSLLRETARKETNISNLDLLMCLSLFSTELYAKKKNIRWGQMG